ncbi:MAG: endospore germination permease [Tissierella sp.]|nr:endospore germination permease [Tissierella sp.]
MKDPKISNIQIRAILVSTIIGIGILSLPNQLATAMDKDGWIPIVLSGLLIIPMIIIINKIFEANPGKDFFMIGNETLGKFFFTIILIIYLTYYIAVCSYISRLLGELIKGFLLPETPIQLIVFLFILSSSYVAVSEINIIARVSYLIYPIVIGFGVLLFLVSLPGSDFTNILPVFQSDLSQLPEGMKVALFSFAGFEVLFFTIPFVEDNRRMTKTSISAIVIVTGLYLVLFLVTLTQFSIQQIKSDPFPLLMIAKLIDLPGFFLQNLDGLVMSIWVAVIFSTFTPLYYSSGKILSKLFKTKTHAIFILILVPVIYFIALRPKSIVELNTLMSSVVNYLSGVVVLIVPIILFVVGRIRGRNKQ